MLQETSKKVIVFLMGRSFSETPVMMVKGWFQCFRIRFGFQPHGTFSVFLHSPLQREVSDRLNIYSNTKDAGSQHTMPSLPH